MEKNITSFNDIIRDKIEEIYKYDNINYFMYNVFNSIDNKDMETYPAAYASLCIIYLDAYKELNSRILDGSASFTELELFSLLDDASNFEEIMDLYCLFPQFLDISISYNIEFNSSSELGKIRKVKQLSQINNKYLLKIAPIHEIDLINYDKTIDKDWLYSYYKDYIDTIEERTIFYNSGIIIDMLASSVSMIDKNNKKEIIDLVLSISKDIFDNINNIENIDFDEKEKIKSLCNIYNYDKLSFVKTCINNRELLSSVFKIYFEMKDRKLIKTIILKKD